MKIAIEDAYHFTQHIGGLNKLAGREISHDVGIYREIKRLENNAIKKIMAYHNGELSSEVYKKYLSVIENKLKKLLPNAKHISLNTDPRGKIFVIAHKEAVEHNIRLGFSGEGILTGF